MRTKFRETLWFKKGQLDAEAAQTQPADSGAIRVDTLPVEDRYVDDGSVLPSDSWVFGVHTGTTQAIETIAIRPGADVVVPEGTLVAEMKTGRRIVFAMIAVLVLALGGAALAVV